MLNPCKSSPARCTIHGRSAQCESLRARRELTGLGLGTLVQSFTQLYEGGEPNLSEREGFLFVSNEVFTNR